MACSRTISSTASSAHDHGAARRARLEKVHQLDAVFTDASSAAAQRLHHVGDGELIMVQLDARHLLAAFEHLLEDLHQVDERYDQFALGAFGS